VTQVRQELGPEHLVFAVPDRRAQNLPVAVGAHPGRDDDSARRHPAALAAGGATDPANETAQGLATALLAHC